MSDVTGESQCEGCDGTGIRVPADPSCLLPAEASNWIVVEKCDYCDRYEDDFAAAAQVFETVKWVQCASAGWHALGRRVQKLATPQCRL